ncbi:MAG: hypothetical protein NZ775_02275 [Gammaproteobacteria bacterium]|nr:hypothetical protein [Gammaproteobacteria bacterium]
MKTNKTLTIGLAALFVSSLALAETEVSGKIIIEHGALIDDGSTISNRTNSAFYAGIGANPGSPVSHTGFTTYKDDISVRIYADGDVSDGVTFHAEVQGHADETSTGGYSGEYTQNAGIREIYADIDAGDGWSARVGKQQIVWGTADGMKLLDIINPTDYAEMAQNQMEDSRVPVWALNLEAGNTQVVISEPKENVFAGLNRGISTDVRRNNNGVDTTVGDTGTNTGNAFMMKGPDTITGQYNGFLNIAPDLGGVATQFAGGFGGMSQLSGFGMQGFTVNAFENMVMGGTNTGMAAAMGGSNMLGVDGSTFAGATVANADYTDTSIGFTNLPDAFQAAIINTAYNMSVVATTNGFDASLYDATDTALLNAIQGDFMLQYGFASQFDTNLADAEAVGETQDTAFDYMQNTSFMTFDAFVNAGSEYVYNMPEGDDADFAIKTSQTTKNGVNYSLNFSNSYDKNPIINMSWRNDAGDELVTTKIQTDTVDNLGVTPTGYMQVNSAATSNYSLMLHDAVIADGTTITATGGDYGGAAGQYAKLRFEQTVNKAQNLGASFDTTIETTGLGPVVIRGEALYTDGSYAPVIDKDKLSYGDLVGALEMMKVDRFKYVLGADITVLTNMMISGQFISDRNLDFVDAGNKYTADFATMHMSNGFNKAIEDKQYYSLFFSKPFGASGQNRWNNIFMSEEGVGENGYWNRFDADFGISDDVVATVEVNTYGGNANTQFGQLDKSDNMQVGVKYSF